MITNNMSQSEMSESLGTLTDAEFDERLLEPYTYLKRIPGKKIRTKLIESFNHWLRIPSDRLAQISEIIETLHNASLLVDDIEDHSLLRRGVPVAHAVFGVPLTLNAANMAYFVALQQVLALRNERAIQVFAAQLLELHRGQGMEIWFRDNFVCPSEEQYVRLVNKKTGGLFKLAVDLMQAHHHHHHHHHDQHPSGATSGGDNDQQQLQQQQQQQQQFDFEPLINLIGLFFQIRDDLANLRSQEYADSKSFCDDLTEGKFSYPIIHFLRTNPTDSSLMDILKQRTRDVQLKLRAIELLEKAGSFEYTVQKLRHIRQEIFDELSKHERNVQLERMLIELCKLIEQTGPTTCEHGSSGESGVRVDNATAETAQTTNTTTTTTTTTTATCATTST